MNFELTEDQRLLADAAERFVRERLSLKPVGERPLPADVWGELASMGWLSLPFPEHLGGMAGTLEDVTVLMVALGRGVVSFPYVSSLILCGGILESFGDRLLCATVIKALIDGSALVSFADGGDPAGRVTMRAKRDPGGALTLNGSAYLCRDASSAGYFIVSAELIESGEMALLLVPRGASGVRLESYQLVDGSDAADIQLSDVIVDQAGRLGVGQEALDALGEAKDRALVAALAQTIGSMEECLEICSAYLKGREQFGRPLASFQALQHMMADMFVQTQEARSILYYALSKLGASPEERSAAVSAAKIVVGDAARVVGRNGIQLHGGYGVTDEFSISHHYRKTLVAEKTYGDLDAHIERFISMSPGQNLRSNMAAGG